MGLPMPSPNSVVFPYGCVRFFLIAAPMAFSVYCSFVHEVPWPELKEPNLRVCESRTLSLTVPPVP